MTTLEILEAARALIAEPEHWCQGVWARNAEGKQVLPNSPDAVRWCAVGAIERAAKGDIQEAWDALRRALPKSWKYLAIYNDSHKHVTIRRLFDKAIAAERREQVQP